MTLDAVVVKVVGSMVTVSPLATSIAPLLVKVVGSMSASRRSKRRDRAAVGEGIAVDLKEPLVPDCLMAPLLTMPSPE